MRNLLILVDGLGYDQVMVHNPPGLSKYGRRLGIAPIRTLLSFSSGIYCSIWSGLYPDEHGVWTEYYRSPDDRFHVSSLFRPLPGKYLPRLFSYLLVSGLNRLGWNGTENFAIPPNLQSCFRRVGSDYRLFPPVQVHPTKDFAMRLEKSRHAWKYLYCDPLDRAAEMIIQQAAEVVDTLILVLPEMDHTGHVFEPAGGEYRRRLMDFDRRLTAMIQSLERAGFHFHLFLFSDHGMTTVERAFDIWTYLEKGGFWLGGEYLAFIHSTVVSLWFDGGRREEILSYLNCSGAGHVLTDTERNGFHLNFPDNKFGDEIFLADEGVECVPNFLNLARKKGKGMHGYDPRGKSTRAFFIGESQLSCRPEDIVGIHRVLEEVMLPQDAGEERAGIEENHVQS
jgi:hypothetical protein